MLKREGGTINGWYKKKFTFTSGRDPVEIIFGIIANDERWREGRCIRTSPIVNLDTDGNLLETENTLYRLGKPATDEDIAIISTYHYGIPSGIEDYEVDDAKTGKNA